MKKIASLIALLASASTFAATLNPIQLLSPVGSSAGQTIVSTGASTAPGWATVPLAGLSSIAANTVVANATASTSAPAAFAMPSCSGTSNALQWTTSTGFTCMGTVNAASLQSFNWAIPAALGTTTPNSGAFTTISASGTITPSQTAGIVGTTTNNNANAGAWGEYQVASATGTSLTTSTNTNTTSLTLSAGDWDIQVNNKFNIAAGATLTSAGTTVTTTTAGGATLGQTTFNSGISATNAIGVVYVTSPVARFSLSATTTIYATGIAVFSGGTVTVDGLIRARRVR